MWKDSTDTLLDTLQALRKQETSYEVSDYLQELNRRVKLSPMSDLPVDATCRGAMAQWCQNMVDFCQYNRTTTQAALRNVDRFLCTPEGFPTLLDRGEYQLLVMTAFYMTAKTTEPQALEPASVSKLSRGIHNPKSVEAMERRILAALKWRINPPTPSVFVELLLDTIPDSLLQREDRQLVNDLVNFQLHAADSEYNLALQKSSVVAFASILNAMDCLNFGLSNLIETQLSHFLGEDRDRIRMARQSLCLVIAKQSNADPLQVALAQGCRIQSSTSAFGKGAVIPAKSVLVHNPAVHQHHHHTSARIVAGRFSQT
eukprot:Nitzschia sp. Nitz4//scaffold49_size126201//38204//39148//NITZ4_003635-RA/size126201-processed-gene-0.92-mRNA-1//-1//CDS//3329553128//5318//frame0